MAMCNTGPEYPLRLPTSLAVIFGSFTLGLYVAIQGPTLMDLIDLLHVNNDIMSYSLAFASLAYSVGGLLSGFLFNYVNRQILIAGYFVVFGVSNIVTPYISNYLIFSVITVFKMMCAGGTDCGANVWILEMWPGQDSWLQALHFSFAVGCALGPLIVEPFLSAESGEKAESELEKLQGFKLSGSTTINDQNNETKIHIPYGVSGLASILAASVILYLYILDQKRRKQAAKLRAKQQAADGEHILMTAVQHPAQLEAGGHAALAEGALPVQVDEGQQQQQQQQGMAELQVIIAGGGQAGAPGSPPAKRAEGNALTETAIFLAPASVAAAADEQQQQLQQSMNNSSSSASSAASGSASASGSSTSTTQPVTDTSARADSPVARVGAGQGHTHGHEEQQQQGLEGGQERAQTPASSPATQPAAVAVSLPIEPAPQQQQQQLAQTAPPPQQQQVIKITSKAREQLVGRPPYYVMFAIALAAMCLSFYCGIEITSMNYLATFAVNIDLQLPKSTAALMSSALTISFAVGRGFGIWIAAYMKPHKLFYLCAGIMAAGNVLMFIFANTVEMLLWYSICLFGIGCGPMFPAIVSFYDDRISKVTNTVSGIFILGSMFNVALNSLIIGHHIIDNALILIVCNLIGSVLLLLLFGTLHMLTKVKKQQRVRKFKLKQQTVADSLAKQQHEQQVALLQQPQSQQQQQPAQPSSPQQLAPQILIQQSQPQPQPKLPPTPSKQQQQEQEPQPQHPTTDNDQQQVKRPSEDNQQFETEAH